MDSNISEYCASLQPKSTTENFNTSKLNFLSLLPLSYGIPTCLVSLLVLYRLLSKKGKSEFYGAFYTCLALSIFIDLITWLHLLFFRELCTAPILDPLFSWIPEAGVIASWAYASQTYFTIAAFISPVVLSLNRFTAVVFYLSDTRLWGQLIKYVFLFYFLFPVIFTWQIFSFQQPIKKCRIENFNSTDAYHTFNQELPAYYVHVSSVLAYVIFVTGFINLLFNFVTIVYLLRRRKSFANKNAYLQKNAPELKLFFTERYKTLICSFNICTEVVFFILVRVLPNGNPIKNALFEYQPFLLDWYYLSPIWIIILLIPRIRTKIQSDASI